MASELLLPLFPLEAVLLPGATLPLHIFEDRYKLMIGEAVEKGSEFGIVLAKDNALVNVGCAATVDTVAKRYPDGRLDIVTVGRRRFEILFLDEQKPYLQGAVHFFDDDPNTGPEPESLRRLTGLYDQLLLLAPSASGGAQAAGSGAITCFRAAGAMPPDLEIRQRLLTSRSEAERVTILSEHLEKLLPRLKLARRVEQASRGNGRGR